MLGKFCGVFASHPSFCFMFLFYAECLTPGDPEHLGLHIANTSLRWFVAACVHVLLVLSETGQVWVVQPVMCLSDAGRGEESKVIPVLIWQSQSPPWDMQAGRK